MAIIMVRLTNITTAKMSSDMSFNGRRIFVHRVWQAFLARMRAERVTVCIKGHEPGDVSVFVSKAAHATTTSRSLLQKALSCSKLGVLRLVSRDYGGATLEDATIGKLLARAARVVLCNTHLSKNMHARCSGVAQVDLDTYGRGPIDVDSIRCFHHAEIVSFTGDIVSAAGIDAACDALGSLPRLRHLKLSRHNMDDTTLVAFCAGLERSAPQVDCVTLPDAWTEAAAHCPAQMVQSSPGDLMRFLFAYNTYRHASKPRLGGAIKGE